MTAPKIALKDQLFHRGNVARIGAEIAAVEPSFEADRFVAEVTGRFAELELKQRIAWISDRLAAHLPADYRTAVGILVHSLPPACDPALTDGDFGDFIYAPYSHFVAQHGNRADDLAVSLDAIRTITTRFSAEDAIRTFINAHPEPTLAVLQGWASDEHYHVRRLCSEGTRPRLPWSARLVTPLDAAVPILDQLFADPTRFVTRSVANHLNDIAKADPDLAVGLLERWRASGRQQPREMDYIVRHGTRLLVKAGHPGALRLVGVEPTSDVAVRNLVCPAEVPLGQALELSFDVVSEESTEVIVDYAISFPGPTGRLGRKIYKLRRLTVTAGEPVSVGHRHLLRAGMTTRRIVPGEHRLDILVNGRPRATANFVISARG